MPTIARAVIFLLTIGYAYGQQYFPSGILGKNADEDEFRNQWYSKHLTALQEPSLLKISKNDATAEEYRFLYLRTGDHPISVRIVVRPDHTAKLISKETSGKGGYEPGRLTRNREDHLSKLQTESFLSAPDDLSFWTLPTLHEQEDKNVVHLDGAQWIFEGLKEGRYHIVDRWSPERSDDPIKIIGITMMIDLAHFKLLYRDVY
jgi:hypothetical protein